MPFDVQLVLNYALYIVIILLLSLSIYYLINIGNRNVDQQNRIILNLDSIQRTLVLIIILLSLLYLFTKYPVILHTLVTVCVAGVLAYLINPLVGYLEDKGLKRNYSIIVVYLVILGFFAILLAIMLPKTIEQVRKLIFSIPNIIHGFESYLDRMESSVFKDNSLFQNLSSQLMDGFTNALMAFQKRALSSIGKTDGSAALVKNLSRIVLAPVISFYFIMDKEKLAKSVIGVVPDRRKTRMVQLIKEIDEVNSEFIRGRLIMALFVGVFTGIFLFILRIDFAIIIGIITCIADIVPYVGPFLGFIPAFILAFMKSPLTGFVVAVVFIVIQWAENNIIAPKVLGTRVGLSPIAILLCLIIGGGMFGFVGMIFAVPFVATMKTVYKFYEEDILNFIFKVNKKEVSNE